MKVTKEYEWDEIKWDELNVGDTIRLPEFTVSETTIKGNKELYFEEQTVKDTATVYNIKNGMIYLIFDHALFKSAVDNNNTKLWCDTQLAQYLRGTFLTALARKTKATDCGLLRKEDLWGDNALPFFKNNGKNRICFDKNEDVSVWYWLETPGDAFAANFYITNYYGDAAYIYANRANGFVRPCLIVNTKQQDN